MITIGYSHPMSSSEKYPAWLVLMLYSHSEKYGFEGRCSTLKSPSFCCCRGTTRSVSASAHRVKWLPGRRRWAGLAQPTKLWSSLVFTCFHRYPNHVSQLHHLNLGVPENGGFNHHHRHHHHHHHQHHHQHQRQHLLWQLSPSKKKHGYDGGAPFFKRTQIAHCCLEMSLFYPHYVWFSLAYLRIPISHHLC